MSRRVDVVGWILLIFAGALGLLMAWLTDLQFVDENTARVLGYSVIFFVVLVLAVRRAWSRRRLWVDIAGLLLLHITVVAGLMNLFSGHLIRLNWVIALPFLGVELSLFLGFLWRRNVSNL